MDESKSASAGRYPIPSFWIISVSAGRRKNLQTVVMLRAERRIGKKSSRETRYYISSLENNAKLALHAAREHWGVENGLHWVLDIAFREDESRLRKEHGSKNFAVLRHIALNLVKQEQTAKMGIKTKRPKPAGMKIIFLRFFRDKMQLP